MVIVSTILLHLLKYCFMFTGGVKLNTSVVFLTKVVVVCVIFIPGFSMWWVLSLSVLLSICRVCIYIYVRLIMSSYLLFCLVYYMLSK